MSVIANQRAKHDVNDTPEKIRDRRGKRVSFPNLQALNSDSDDDYDDWKSGTRDDASERDSQSLTSR